MLFNKNAISDIWGFLRCLVLHVFCTVNSDKEDTKGNQIFQTNCLSNFHNEFENVAYNFFLIHWIFNTILHINKEVNRNEIKKGDLLEL